MAAQPTTLYLFKEGMFYKAYNQNPMWFVQHIKAYKVTAKYIKTIQQEEYFIGFPIKYLNSFTLEPYALKKTRYYIYIIHLFPKSAQLFSISSTYLFA